MKPSIKKYLDFKPLLENISIEIVEDIFPVEDNGFNTNLIERLQEEGQKPEENRFDVKINGRYIKRYNSFVNRTYKAFIQEVQRNVKVRSIMEGLDEYILEVESFFTNLSNKYSDIKVPLNGQYYYITFNETVDDRFIKDEEITKEHIFAISKMFESQRDLIIETLNLLSDYKEHGTVRKEEDIPEEWFDSIQKENSPTNALDIYQTALLFHYLKVHKLIGEQSAANLARIVAALTGHSEQNLRTEKGFGNIANILADKTKNQHYKDSPNYNLLTLREHLQKIIKDIEKQIDKNNR
jgi:hypothetical protein